MNVEQIYTNCLAHGAYYIESNGEAAIIDPLREIQPYIDMAKKRGASIKYIFETHFHADFVSGHKDLSEKTGAPIVYGPTIMKTGFDITVGKDGQKFKLGDVQIELIHTPGHTMESSCYLLYNEAGKPVSIFTGDTLFIGDVGRPDLAQHVISDLTEDKLAGHLYDSIHNKLLPLPDDIIVYPGHGAGSACGKKMSSETSDTLGQQKRTNYALRADMSKEDFKKELLTGLTPPPGYFPKNVLMNIQGYTSIDEVLAKGTTAIDVDEFEKMSKDPTVLVVDTRKAKTYGAGFIPGAVNIGIDGSFAVWVGTVIPDISQRILVVADEGREEEIVTRLARVGYDHTVGYLKGGFDAWKSAGKKVDTIPSISADEFAKAEQQDPDILILDVRKKSEYDSEHIENAVNTPLDYFEKAMDLIDKSKTYYVHCAAGYRSMLFTSLLRKRGYTNLIDVDGGFKAIKESNKFRITEYVCPTTLL